MVELIDKDPRGQETRDVRTLEFALSSTTLSRSRRVELCSPTIDNGGAISYAGDLSRGVESGCGIDGLILFHLRSFIEYDAAPSKPCTHLSPRLSAFSCQSPITIELLVSVS